GTDQVEAENFSGFDYVALGHIHGGQQIGDRPVYYSGSPVKYSFSEVHHEKAVVLVEIDGQKTVEVTRLPLSPIHDMRKIRGKLADLISPAVAEAADEEDYILAVLTDDGELADPMGTLRSVYPNVMQLQWERKTVNFEETERSLETIREKSPLELFEDFFEQVMGKSLTEEQREIMKQTIETAGEESE
ncbi:MAG: exonuclease SbcCD subunit D, partial [Lachnospiraceae bacterium]